jgi:methyl-accepting chemotaxis protein
MDRLKISERLALLLVLPFLAVLVLAGEMVWERYDDLQRQRRMQPFLEIAASGSDLVHELQRERGISAGFLAARGAGDHPQRVAAQRPLTDKAAANFQATATALAGGRVSADLTKRLDEIAARLGRLPAHRTAVDAQTMDGAANLAFFSDAVEAALGLGADIVRLSEASRTISDVVAYRALAAAKEAAGLERAQGNALLARRAFDLAGYLGFIENGTRRRMYLKIGRAHV